MGADPIETRRLSKRYRRVLAVDDVSLRVRAGEIYGFLGLNGAGKSTTIRMLLGMTSPSAGTTYLFGEPVLRGAGPWSQVGYLVDGAHAYPRLTVRQNLDLVRRLRGVSEPSTIDTAIDSLGLSAYADQAAGTLSLGNAQRLGLAKALLHRPTLLILDEPANGLDPAGIVELRNLLGDLAATGVAILVSSHILAEVARLATRVGVIDQGRLLTEFDADELHQRARQRLRIDARDRRAAWLALRANGLQVSEGEHGLEVSEQWAIDRPDHVAQLLTDAGVPPTTLYVWQEDLETYFLRLLAEHRCQDGT